jgi:uncharacterized membrane protein YhaH (DUF805 family)
MEMMLQPLRKYADFEGRARRSEYWLFQLFIWGVIIGLYAVAAILSVIFLQPAASGPEPLDPNDPAVGGAAAGSMIIFAIIGLFFLAMIIPNLAVRIRRLHDIGLSGWFILIGLVPGLGGLALLVMALLEGNYGSNTFGPDPKGRGKPSLAETFN